MESGKALLIRFTSSSQRARLKNLKRSVSLQPSEQLTRSHGRISAMDRIDYRMPWGEDKLEVIGIHVWKYWDDD
jgi:hypothetical protein